MSTQSVRTFADMTPEEREKCIGMWVETQAFNQPRLGIFFDWLAQRNEAIILRTDNRQKVLTHLHKLIPRFDLPRAWNPDGTPVVADPEEYTTDGRSRVYFEGIEKVAFPPGTRVRRWVSDWEEIE